MGLMHGARAMHGEISDTSNHGKGEKTEERVDRTSYFFKLLSRGFQARFDRRVRLRSARLCLLRADSLATHVARPRTRPKRPKSEEEEVVRPENARGERGAEIHREPVTSARPVLLGRRFSCAL